MGEEDTKATVEPKANGTSSFLKTSDVISGKEAHENASGEEAKEIKKDENTGPEKMEMDDEIKQHEGKKETEVTEKETKVETEKKEEKDVNKDKEQAETAKMDEDKGQPEADKMDEDTDEKKLKADDGVSGGAIKEDTVMKKTVESDDNKDIKGADNKELKKKDTTEGGQEKTEKESQEEKLGGNVNGNKEGNKEDIHVSDMLVGGDKGDDVDEDTKVANVNEIKKEEAPNKNNEGGLAEDGKEEETNKEEELKEANQEDEVDEDAEPKVGDEKRESKDKDESDMDDSKDEKEDSKKFNKRGKGKTEKDIEPRTPFSDRPVRERKSVERLVALVDKDSSKEFHVEKVCQ